MRIALIAPPFISIPPKDYGGTELFIAQLAEGLKKAGMEVVVYTNGESTVDVERRWIYQHAQWPIRADHHASLKDMDHTSWAVNDAAETCDVIHMHTAQGLTCSRFVRVPVVYTLHHPHIAQLSEFYARYPDVYYVGISEFQRQQETMPRTRMIYHGIDLSQYRLYEQKQHYLSFIGRIAPLKGTHLAIDVAKRAGIPLKIAGDIQPLHREYFEAKIKPQIDGKFIEYIGLADLEAKNELLGNSIAMLFPIKWDEPFGLVMVEAMACGTPVLSLPGGSVPEIVRDGISGYVCGSVKELAKRAVNINFDPRALREYVEQNFSLPRMVREYQSLYKDVQIQNVARKIA
jgi:glycosyltransferase involved in cell wall biosynthesis